MPLFFSADELRQFACIRHTPPAAGLLDALRERVRQRSDAPGLVDRQTTVDWWHCAAEHLTDAAGLFAVCPEPAVGRWLRDAALAVARMDEAAWVGPPFRDHLVQPARGNLETAHLGWGLAVALDLAPALYTEEEREEIRVALRTRALPLCQRWLEHNGILSNWRCVLTAGLAVPAAVLDDRPAIAEAVRHYQVAVQAFQADGSYGESLQYANYAAFHLMLAWEALVRRQPALAVELPLLPHGRMVNWAACSHFYQKPMGGGWGSEPRPRAANFGDSAAIFRPTADLLLHLANRAATAEPATAGIGRWLFDTLYVAQLRTGPWDRASFGFVNHFGFLSLPLLAGAAAPLTPAAAGLPVVAAFANGDVLARDAWDGRTILALRTGGTAPLACCGHLHGDLNSFILVHDRERLLVDPGHSCYRGLIRELEAGSRCHNTCTFAGEATGYGLQEEVHAMLQQSAPRKRLLDARRQPLAPIQRATRTLLNARLGEVTAVVSEVSAAYGPAVSEFTRIWLLAGPHSLFVIDFISSATPLRTTWHWVLNNRDGALALELEGPDRLSLRRGSVALKFLHVGPGRLAGTSHGFVHDAYHPLPAQLGEGASGSGTLVQFTERHGATQRRAIHAMVFGASHEIVDCKIHPHEGSVHLQDPAHTWVLTPDGATRRLHLRNDTDRSWTLAQSAEQGWTLT